MKNISNCLLTIILLTACASHHDLGSGRPSLWGGGIYSEQLRPGLFYILAKSNVAPWENQGAALGTWRERAEQLCHGKNYREIDIEQRVDEPIPPAGPFLSYLITVRKGYAVCEESGLSDIEALQIIDKQAAGINP